MAAFEISSDILNKATLCDKGFVCLESLECMCGVVDSIEYFILFVDDGDNSFCKYKMKFRDRFTCECPVRKEFSRRCGR